MKTEVFLCTSPAHFPFIFAYHTWFVIHENGKHARYEVLHQRNKKDNSLGHLHINDSGIFDGLGIIIGLNWKWNGKIISRFNGQNTQELIKIIKNTEGNCQYLQEYSLSGPNSNTYIQSILHKFPEWKIKLPKNAFGRNFKRQK